MRTVACKLRAADLWALSPKIGTTGKADERKVPEKLSRSASIVPEGSSASNAGWPHFP